MSAWRGVVLCARAWRRAVHACCVGSLFFLVILLFLCFVVSLAPVQTCAVCSRGVVLHAWHRARSRAVASCCTRGVVLHAWRRARAHGTAHARYEPTVPNRTADGRPVCSCKAGPSINWDGETVRDRHSKPLSEAHLCRYASTFSPSLPTSGTPARSHRGDRRSFERGARTA